MQRHHEPNPDCFPVRRRKLWARWIVPQLCDKGCHPHFQRGRPTLRGFQRPLEVGGELQRGPEVGWRAARGRSLPVASGWGCGWVSVAVPAPGPNAQDSVPSAAAFWTFCSCYCLLSLRWPLRWLHAQSSTCPCFCALSSGAQGKGLRVPVGLPCPGEGEPGSARCWARGPVHGCVGCSLSPRGGGGLAQF